MQKQRFQELSLLSLASTNFSWLPSGNHPRCETPTIHEATE